MKLLDVELDERFACGDYAGMISAVAGHVGCRVPGKSPTINLDITGRWDKIIIYANNAAYFYWRGGLTTRIPTRGMPDSSIIAEFIR